MRMLNARNWVVCLTIALFAITQVAAGARAPREARGAGANNDVYQKQATAWETYHATINAYHALKGKKPDAKQFSGQFRKQLQTDFRKEFGVLQALGLFNPKSVPTSAQAQKAVLGTVKQCGAEGAALSAQMAQLAKQKTPIESAEWAKLATEAAALSREYAQHQAAPAGKQAQCKAFNPAAIELALNHLSQNYPEYAAGRAQALAQLRTFKTLQAELLGAYDELLPLPIQNSAKLTALNAQVELLAAFQRELLVNRNPLLDFDKLLIVKRKGNIGLPANWQGNTDVEKGNYDNEIAALDLRGGQLQTVYKPEEPIFVGDVDLHFDGKKMLFSTNGAVCEVGLDGTGFRKVIDKIDSYDACYLPDGRLLFSSASGFHAVPCVGGKSYVGNLHVANADGSGIRRLCFDQDNNWYPVMMENGRVMYTRWEYTDSAHYFSRVLMTMNPDGTNQAAFYGSNSYWPNSIFYARPVPGHPTKFVAVITGHHGVKRMGELILFDAAKGRHEADGVIQRIPGYGQPVPALIKDRLVDASWPRFLHPYPLDDTFILTACQPSPSSSWGIYLVDVFDNITLLKEDADNHLLEPLPLRQTTRPPVIADRVDPNLMEAAVLMTDVYRGTGLEGVPRGSVKNLRVLQYEYAYRHTGGHYVIGFEGPWDVRRLLGTVPVNEDGSAYFKVPANVPLAIQPLDAEGKALAQMRSWFTAMPGEFVSCVGCHEKQNSAPPTDQIIAARKQATPITPWRGAKRGFSFRREVQPVLDKNCVGCHDGKKEDRPNFSDEGLVDANGQSQYSQGYLALHPFVRRNGPEGDYHALIPLEFHADTSELVQLLEKGHHGVRLDEEAWDRLITWIDLNVPFHGTWMEAAPKVSKEYVDAHRENLMAYAGVDENIEEIINPYLNKVAFVQPPKVTKAAPAPVSAANWPFTAETARVMQGEQREISLDLGDGLAMRFVRVPAGEFVMGSTDGADDERPRNSVRIEKAFWLGALEVTNEQYLKFDPKHDSGVYDKHYKDQVDRGYYVNQPDKPAIRVSWQRANEFCEWLSKQTGRRASLPTEAQWEWACRAGTDTPMWWGATDASFGKNANLADVTIKELAVRGVNPQPVKDPDQYWAFVPANLSEDDGVLHLAAPGQYAANAWGLHDMIGNVAEWTSSGYYSYPYNAKNETAATVKKVVRGGSWRDRTHRATSSFRLAFPAWQRVYNVGFRVALDDRPSGRQVVLNTGN